MQDDNRCGIYETRPQVCRDYSTKDCEYEDDWTYDFYLETTRAGFEYCEAMLPGRVRHNPQPEAGAAANLT